MLGIHPGVSHAYAAIVQIVTPNSHYGISILAQTFEQGDHRHPNSPPNFQPSLLLLDHFMTTLVRFLSLSLLNRV